jgi:hypothetical protein
VFFFENEDTRRRFEAEPQRFASKAAGVNSMSAEALHPRAPP